MFNKIFSLISLFFTILFVFPTTVSALFDCQSGFSSPVQSTQYKTGHIGSINVDYYVLKVDLGSSSVNPYVTPKTNLGTTTSQFAQTFNAEIAINGDYHIGTSPLGIAASDGNVYSNPTGSGEPTFYTLTDRSFNIQNLGGTPPANVWQAISGAHTIVTGGVPNPGKFSPCTDPTYCTTSRARTSIGISGNELIIIVIDEGTSSSTGITLRNLADMYVDCGASKAINMDGGGSTTMVLNGSVVNNPSTGAERSVANHLGVCIGHVCGSSTSITPGPPVLVPIVGPRPPIPDPVVPCARTSNEFHSLRPYEANPCKYNRSRLDTICGNDLVVLDDFSIGAPVNTGSWCSGPGSMYDRNITNCFWAGPACVDGSVLNCHYADVTRYLIAGIDPYSSVFPIMGNTEWDTNALLQNQNVLLNYPIKVNEYISWYLHGATYRSEKPPIGADTDVVEQNGKYVSNYNVDTQNPSDEEILINYPGPIRKLMPFDPQNQIRTWQMDAAGQSGRRHNQIVACTKLTLADLKIPFTNITLPIRPEYIPVPCYDDSGFKLFQFPRNLLISDFSYPPQEYNYINQLIQDFLKDYMIWKGLACISVNIPGWTPITGPVPNLGIKKIFICMDDISSFNYQGMLFPYIPFTFTEDREGLINAQSRLSNYGTNEEDNWQINKWLPKPDSDIRTAGTTNYQSVNYFAHTEENIQLMGLLQKTYLPGTDNDPNTVDFIPDDWDNAGPSGPQKIGIPDPIPFVQNSRCSIPDTRFNPGDRLFGQKLTNDFTYNIDFDCSFKYTCVWICDVNGYCYQSCSFSTCYLYHYWGSKIQVRVPLAKELWITTVAGNASFFKRVFPKVEPGSAVSDIYDIPGESPIIHFTNVKLISQNPEIYFPHLGAIKEYFLSGIQTILRPRGYASGNPQWWTTGGGTTFPPGSCSFGTGYCTPNYLFTTWNNLADYASQICNMESGSNPNVANVGCLTGSTCDFSVGLFQINLVAHCSGAFTNSNCGGGSTCQVANPGSATGCSNYIPGLNDSLYCNSQLLSCLQQYLDPDQNISKAYSIYQSQGWCAWKIASTTCGIMSSCP